MAGAEHGDQLVAQLFVAHRAAVVVAGLQQQREHVVVALLAGFDLRAAQADLLVDELVERFARAQEARPGAAGAEVAAQGGEGGDQADALAEVVDQRLEAGQPLLVVDAEDGAHDHRQGDPLGVGAQREGLADRPGLHLPARRLADQLAVAAHPLAVEGRQQQLALLHVRRVVEGQHRVRAERRLEHGRVGLAGVELLGRAGEDRFDQGRVGDVERRPKKGKERREDVAVAALQLDQEAERVAGVAQRLQQGRRLRARAAGRGGHASGGRRDRCLLHRTAP